jgi:hypothetical protein
VRWHIFNDTILQIIVHRLDNIMGSKAKSFLVYRPGQPRPEVWYQDENQPYPAPGSDGLTQWSGPAQPATPHVTRLDGYESPPNGQSEKPKLSPFSQGYWLMFAEKCRGRRIGRWPKVLNSRPTLRQWLKASWPDTLLLFSMMGIVATVSDSKTLAFQTELIENH